MSNEPAGSFRDRSGATPDGPASARRLRRGLVTGLLLGSLCGAADGGAPQHTHSMPDDVAQRLSRLDCTRISAEDVRDVLARVPAPRIMLFQGSVAFVTMEPFAQFLIGMGYPAESLRNPRDGGNSYSSYADSAAIAGEIAWDYERSGLEAMMIGHSQGGMLAIRVLYELAGAFHESLPVVDPATGDALPRTTIVDPLTGDARPVVGLHVAYAAALATGWLPRLLLGQWTMLPRLRRIPPTVTEFTGFDIPHDPIAGNLLGITPYTSIGTAQVRNVMLPSHYGHLELPRTDRLAQEHALRAWIDAWRPDAGLSPPGDTENLVHAADIWYSVKHHWCAQAQRLLLVPSS